MYLESYRLVVLLVACGSEQRFSLQTFKCDGNNASIVNEKEEKCVDAIEQEEVAETEEAAEVVAEAEEAVVETVAEEVAIEGEAEAVEE